MKAIRQPLTLLYLSLAILIGGCTGLPKGVQPVDNFQLNQYLGKWYEIARLDHSFERGLSHVTAEYSLRDDGGVKVINKGFSTEDGIWKKAEGRAYSVRKKNEGYLKVSFFGPFYGAYVVFDLDQRAYQHSFVAGYNQSYLWLLSRTPTVSDKIIQGFIKKSKELGFNTDELIFPDQN